MMKNLTDGFAAAPQITADVMVELAEMGFSDVICNRPDVENGPSEQSDVMQAAAESAGLKFHFVPIDQSNLLQPENTERTKEIIANATGKIFAYCRSGTRSTYVWSLAQVGQMPADEIIETAAKAGYDVAQLRPMLGRRPQELSGGQQQRCALARAIAKESRAVFLDEPLANLDYKLREELREQLPELFAGRGAVVVYATSEPEEALLLGGKTALMNDGVVTQFGTTAEIYRKPDNLTSARVFSDPPINSAEVVKQGQKARMKSGAAWDMDGAVADLPDGSYTLAIRPHHVTPTPAGPDDVAIAGTVLVTELSGSESSAHFQMGTDGWVSLAHGVHPYEVGQEYRFFMDPRNAFYFDPDGRLVA